MTIKRFSNLIEMPLKAYQNYNKSHFLEIGVSTLKEVTADLISKQNQLWESSNPKKSKNRMDFPVVQNLPVKGTPEYITRQAWKAVLPEFMNKVEDLNAEYNLNYRKVIQRPKKTKVSRKKIDPRRMDQDNKPF